MLLIELVRFAAMLLVVLMGLRLIQIRIADTRVGEALSFALH